MERERESGQYRKVKSAVSSNRRLFASPANNNGIVKEIEVQFSFDITCPSPSPSPSTVVCISHWGKSLGEIIVQFGIGSR